MKGVCIQFAGLCCMAYGGPLSKRQTQALPWAPFAGMGDPYLIAQIWQHMREEPFVDDVGFEAVSAHGDSAPELPHLRLAEINRQYWDLFKAAGHALVPTVSAGWDGRPRSYEGSWFVKATPEEVASTVCGALDWAIESHTTSPANTGLNYAWNEFDEGGWLCPTLDEGSARLDAISLVVADRHQ